MKYQGASHIAATDYVHTDEGLVMTMPRENFWHFLLVAQNSLNPSWNLDLLKISVLQPVPVRQVQVRQALNSRANQM